MDLEEVTPLTQGSGAVDGPGFSTSTYGGQHTPSWRTTVRAELEAIYRAMRVLEQAPWIEDIKVYSDCKAVVDGFTKGRELTLMGDMGALWYEGWEIHGRIVSSGDRYIRVHKVKKLRSQRQHKI